MFIFSGPYYLPGFAKNNKAEISLPSQSSLEIGYGSGGANPQSYFLRENQEVDIGSLKLFYATEYVDFSNIPQKSPFDARQMKTKSSRKRNAFWGTKTVKIVQRKGKK
jgi:hypothetical protein